MSRKEATALLKTKISEYVKDPIVNLRLTNFTITVLGEVNRPGSFIIDDELYKFAINGSLENGIGLGTNNEDFASGISVYPNPAIDYINVDLSKTSIVSDFIINLYDINGRQVAIQANNEQIATHTLDTGSYILVLTSGDDYFSEVIQIYR